jgi:hypothetical protein
MAIRRVGSQIAQIGNFFSHLNWRFACKVMGLKIEGIPIVGISGQNDQNDIWVLVPWLGVEYIIKGKVVAFPKFRPW